MTIKTAVMTRSADEQSQEEKKEMMHRGEDSAGRQKDTVNKMSRGRLLEGTKNTQRVTHPAKAGILKML